MITVKNQTPIELFRTYPITISGDYDPLTFIKSSIIEPIYSKPITKNQDVSIQIDKNDINQDDLTTLLIDALVNQNINVEQDIKEIYEKTLLSFKTNSNLRLNDLFVIQSQAKTNLPEPSQQVVYTPAIDVIPAAKNFLAGNIDFDEWFTTLSFYTRTSIFGVSVVNNQAFEDFKNYIKQELSLINNAIPQNTINLFNEFDKITLNQLTESLVLRNDDSDNNEEYSFARMLIYFVINYAKKSSNTFDIMPFGLEEFFNPKSIVFINVDEHAHKSANQIKNEWNIINQSVANKVKIINPKKLNKLTAVQRNINRIQQSMGKNQQIQKIVKTRKVKFSKETPKQVDLVKRIKKVMNKMSTVNRSENSFKSIKMTYQKPNRRDPDDFNKQGKIVSQKYLPDLHIYLDTSGSISEQNYKDSVYNCIKMAKKLNINMYFNSFSHVMTPCTKLHTKDKSLNQIYKEFRNAPKVSGGTDFKQVWKYIEQSNKRKRELSIMITDFGDIAPSTYMKHPNNLYYIPIAAKNQAEFEMIKQMAQGLIKSATHIEPNLRRRILF